MVIYVSTLPWIPACFLKRKAVKRFYSSESEAKIPTGANSDILGVAKSNSPQRCISGSAFNLCVASQKKCVIIVAIENEKLKLLKVLSSYHNALCAIVLSFFFTTIYPGDTGPLDILRKV